MRIIGQRVIVVTKEQKGPPHPDTGKQEVLVTADDNGRTGVVVGWLRQPLAPPEKRYAVLVDVDDDGHHAPATFAPGHLRLADGTAVQARPDAEEEV